MNTVAHTPTTDTIPSPPPIDLRARLHAALDALYDAGDGLSVPDAAAADQAFVTMLRIARAKGGAR